MADLILYGPGESPIDRASSSELDGNMSTWEDEVLVVHETEKAYLLNYEGEEEWVPKSQIVSMDENLGAGDSGNVEIPIWLAKQAGWV